MTSPSEAAQVLLELAASLRANPDQFNYAVNINVGSITGLHASASAPGSTGMSVVLGPGASGTGVHIQAGIHQADIEFAEAAATEAERALIREAANVIEAIAHDMADGEPSSVKAKAESLAKLAIPPCISAIVAALIGMVLGA